MVGYLVTGNRTSVPEVFPTCKVGPLAADAAGTSRSSRLNYSADAGVSQRCGYGRGGAGATPLYHPAAFSATAAERHLGLSRSTVTGVVCG